MIVPERRRSSFLTNSYECRIYGERPCRGHVFHWVVFHLFLLYIFRNLLLSHKGGHTVPGGNETRSLGLYTAYFLERRLRPCTSVVYTLPIYHTLRMRPPRSPMLSTSPAAAASHDAGRSKTNNHSLFGGEYVVLHHDRRGSNSSCAHLLLHVCEAL